MLQTNASTVIFIFLHFDTTGEDMSPGWHRFIDKHWGTTDLNESNAPLTSEGLSHSMTVRASCGDAGLGARWRTHRLRISYLEQNAKGTWYGLPGLELNPNWNTYTFTLPGVPQALIHAPINDLLPQSIEVVCTH